MAAKAFSSILKDSNHKRLPLVTGPKTFQFPLHTKRPTESFLFLLKTAFVLNTPGNVRAIGIFIEDSGPGDVEEYQSPPARGTGGPVL